MKILGEVPFTPFIVVCFCILLATPGYTYYMAVYVQHSEKPYPYPTITSTACHYPQDIVFRYTMLIATFLIGLIFFIVSRWTNQVAKKIGYPGRIRNWQFWMAQISVALYTVAIGTIDGKSTGKYHGPAAVTFFVMWFYILNDITFLLTKMKNWDSSCISCTSLFIKQLLVVYIVGIWIYCIIGLILNSQNGKSDKFVVIIEWNSVNINLCWILSFAMEWKYFKMALATDKQSDENEQSSRAIEMEREY